MVCSKSSTLEQRCSALILILDFGSIYREYGIKGNKIVAMARRDVHRP